MNTKYYRALKKYRIFSDVPLRVYKPNSSYSYNYIDYKTDYPILPGTTVSVEYDYSDHSMEGPYNVKSLISTTKFQKQYYSYDRNTSISSTKTTLPVTLIRGLPITITYIYNGTTYTSKSYYSVNYLFNIPKSSTVVYLDITGSTEIQMWTSGSSSITLTNIYQEYDDGDLLAYTSSPAQISSIKMDSDIYTKHYYDINKGFSLSYPIYSSGSSISGIYKAGEFYILQKTYDILISKDLKTWVKMPNLEDQTESHSRLGYILYYKNEYIFCGTYYFWRSKDCLNWHLLCPNTMDGWQTYLTDSSPYPLEVIGDYVFMPTSQNPKRYSAAYYIEKDNFKRINFNTTLFPKYPYYYNTYNDSFYTDNTISYIKYDKEKDLYYLYGKSHKLVKNADGVTYDRYKVWYTTKDFITVTMHEEYALSNTSYSSTDALSGYMYGTEALSSSYKKLESRHYSLTLTVKDIETQEALNTVQFEYTNSGTPSAYFYLAANNICYVNITHGYYSSGGVYQYQKTYLYRWDLNSNSLSQIYSTSYNNHQGISYHASPDLPYLFLRQHTTFYIIPISETQDISYNLSSYESFNPHYGNNIIQLLCYNSALYLAQNFGNTTSFYRSTDGLTWNSWGEIQEEYNPTEDLGWSCTLGSGGLLFPNYHNSNNTLSFSDTLRGYSKEYSKELIYTTKDLKTFTLDYVKDFNWETDDFSDIAFGNNKYVRVNWVDISSTSVVYSYSSDGINWTKATYPSDSNIAQPRWVVYDKGAFIARPNYGGYIARSTDGINWTSVYVGGLSYTNTFTKVKDGVVVLSADGGSYYSTDGGATWKMFSGSSNKIMYVNNKYWTWSSDSLHLMCASTLPDNSRGWTEIPIPFNGDIKDIIPFNNKLFIQQYRLDHLLIYDTTTDITSTQRVVISSKL